MLRSMLNTKNANGWNTTSWMNTETSYSILPDVPSYELTPTVFGSELGRAGKRHVVINVDRYAAAGTARLRA
jgi:hypothetical protein